MRIHKEGASIILITAVFAAVVMVSAAYLLPSAVAWAVAVAALACVVFVTSFFRCPSRPPVRDENGVYSPADGTVVALEEVEENEYFHDTRIVVSVFMSIWNVHVNWFPVSGTVDYFRHHHGMFMVAWHPKSSEDNERTTTVIDMGRAEDSVPPDRRAGRAANRFVCPGRGPGRAEHSVRFHQVRLAGRSVPSDGCRRAGAFGRQGRRYADADRRLKKKE